MNRFFFSLVLAALVLAASPASAGEPIFFSGFETGDTSEWTDNIAADDLVTSVERDEEDWTLAEFSIESDIKNNKSGVSPGDEDIFIPPFLCRGQVSSACGFSFVIETAGGGMHTCGTVAAQVVTPNPTPPGGDTNLNWRVPDRGRSREFQLIVAFDNEGCAMNSFRMRQTGFSYDQTPDAVGTTLFPLVQGGFVTPSMILWGETSDFVPEESAEALIRALPHPVGTPGVLTFVETRPGLLELVVE